MNAIEKWKKRNAWMHQLAAQVCTSGITAHEMLQTMAAELYNIESITELTEKQQLDIIARLKKHASAANGLLDIAGNRISNGQKIAIKAAADRGLGWSRDRLHADMDKVYGHHNINALTTRQANKYIQRLNQIRKHSNAEAQV